MYASHAVRRLVLRKCSFSSSSSSRFSATWIAVLWSTTLYSLTIRAIFEATCWLYLHTLTRSAETLVHGVIHQNAPILITVQKAQISHSCSLSTYSHEAGFEFRISIVSVVSQLFLSKQTTFQHFHRARASSRRIQLAVHTISLSVNLRHINQCIVCLCMTTLTEVFPCLFLSCKANARVKPAKTGHDPHSS